MLQQSIDTNVGPAHSPFTCIQDAGDAVKDASDGARLLADFWVEQGVCFTSGHAVNALRLARGKTLMVNQRPVGQALQDYFNDGDMPSYMAGDGSVTRPFRKEMFSTRTDTRTPVGTGVFVYGPSEEAIDLFEWEINITEAPDVSDGQGGLVSPATALLQATPNTAPTAPGASSIPAVQPSGHVAVAHGKMVPGNPTASIHKDGRLCIPRVAFEALAFETGDAIVGGEPLFVTVKGDELVISTVETKGSGTAVPTSDRLRLHLTMPQGRYPVGTTFEVVVNEDTLILDLGHPILLGGISPL